MSLPNKLGISFTAAELTAIKDGANAVIGGITSKIVLNLSEAERSSISKVGDERLPFILKSIQDYGNNLPAFNPIAWPHADAVKDVEVFASMGEVLTLLSQAQEVVRELQMAAGHFCFRFMIDQYDLAKKNVENNITGAQTIVDGLEGAFEGQGPQPTPANP